MLRGKTALIVGVGGLGCPAAIALVDAGIGRLVLADDDQVDETNLHRQILFADADIGRDKLEAAKRALLVRSRNQQAIELVHSRFLPDNARELARQTDVVLEGADNFATKFLVADACHLERIPVIHGAAIRWRGTAFSVSANGRPCYRCLFEDVPLGKALPNCAEAGVVGPMVGVVGALMADLALRSLASRDAPTDCIYTYDGIADTLRAVQVTARTSCALCGEDPRILAIDETRYTSPGCAA